MARRKQRPRDTYRYHYIYRGKIAHRGITDDLKRREMEHQQKRPGGHIKQIGPRVTGEAAENWEKEGGKRLP